MPNKPTEPYAYIEFGKDGSVRKVVETLPADKDTQERLVAEHFVRRLFPDVAFGEAIERLPERDNDFRLHLPGRRPITLELIELASREYISQVDAQDWYNNSHKYPYTMQRVDEVGGKKIVSVYNIDLKKKGAVLTQKIAKKLRYAKPSDSDFWLLIWTCQTEFVFAGSGPNGDFEDAGVQTAREFLARQVNAPFDEVWVTNMLMTPYRIFR